MNRDWGVPLPRNIEAAVRRDLDAALSAADHQTLNGCTGITRAPNVSHAITEYARHNAIDLIVVGTHGRGAIQRFLIGSVAERVMRTAAYPVLTVRVNEPDFVDSQKESQVAAAHGSAARM